MKKFLLLSLLSCLVLFSCNKKEPDYGPIPKVTAITVTPQIPLAFQDITFSIVVDAKGEPYTSVLEWRVNPNVETKYETVMMKKSESNVTSAKISGFVTGAKLEYRFRVSTKQGRVILSNSSIITIGADPNAPQEQE